MVNEEEHILSIKRYCAFARALISKLETIQICIILIGVNGVKILTFV